LPLQTEVCQLGAKALCDSHHHR